MASKLDFDRSQDSSWFSDYYYGKLAYHDINLRSYFGAIRPPNRFNLGFRLGKSIILHSPKKTSVHLFVPRRPPRRGRGGGGFRGGDQGGAKKGQIWEIKDVSPIGCLGEGKEAIEDQNKEEGLKRKQSSQSIKKNLADLLSVSRTHPRNAEVRKDMAFMVDDVSAFRRTKLSNFLFPGGGKGSTELLKKTLPAVNPSMKYFVMQYLLKTSNNMPFDPVAVLNHMVAKGEGSIVDEKRMHSQIRFFLESLTNSEEDSLAKKKLNHSIQQASDVSLAGTRKKTATMSLIPFYGATFPFLRDGVNKKSLVDDGARERVLDLLRVKCWNLIGNTDKGMEMVENIIREGGGGENLSKGIEMMTEIILRNRRIPYGFNSYLNEVMKMQSLVSNSTNTITSINSVKIKSFYQSAALIAEEISVQLRTKKSFRAIFSQLVRELPSAKGVQGIRVTCSGRLGGAEIAKTETGKYGKTSTATFDQKVDYAFTEAATRYGIIGVKVWISYQSKKKPTDKKEAKAGGYGLLS